MCDHYKQTSGDASLIYVDFWRDDAPARGENGTYSTWIYAREVSLYDTICRHTSPYDITHHHTYSTWIDARVV